MSDHIQQTIEAAIEKVRALEADIAIRKASVNNMCRLFDRPEVYADTETKQGSSNGPVVLVQRNAYFGKGFSTAIQEYLKARERANLQPKEATLDEIISALKDGGYDFKGQSSDGVAISLGKNSATFAKLPTGDYGLQAWYGITKKKKTKDSSSSEASEDSVTTDDKSDDKAAETMNSDGASSDPDPTAEVEFK